MKTTISILTMLEVLIPTTTSNTTEASNEKNIAEKAMEIFQEFSLQSQVIS